MKSRNLIAVATAAAFAFSGAALANAQEEAVPQTEDQFTEESYTMPTEPVPEAGMATEDDVAAMPQTEVTEADLRSALEQVGYTEIDNVSIEAPMWSAEAVNPQGDAVLVQIDASTATIVSEQPVDSEDAE